VGGSQEQMAVFWVQGFSGNIRLLEGSRRPGPKAWKQWSWIRLIPEFTIRGLSNIMEMGIDPGGRVGEQ